MNEQVKINRIFVEYYRDTVIVSDDAELTQHYSEYLVLDRERETIEHHLKPDGKLDITWICHDFPGVADFLDSFDNSLFKKINGNPEDTIPYPNERRTYKITVSYSNGSAYIVSNIYDINGIPVDYEVFTDELWDIISSFGSGELFNPSILYRHIRAKGDYIYLSVEFRPDDVKTYYYTTDDDSIEIGDFLIVPAGRVNRETLVRVVDKEYFSENEAPIEYDCLKSVIRRTEMTWEHDEDVEGMMYESEGKFVKITLVGGRTVIGKVLWYTDGDESESGYPQIDIKTPEDEYYCVDYQEIKSIEVRQKE